MILHRFLGAMSKKFAIFKTGKYVHVMVAIFLASPLGGDVEKINDFQEGNTRSHGSIFWHHLLEAMLRKVAIFRGGAYLDMVPFVFVLPPMKIFKQE